MACGCSRYALKKTSWCITVSQKSNIANEHTTMSFPFSRHEWEKRNEANNHVPDVDGSFHGPENSSSDRCFIQLGMYFRDVVCIRAILRLYLWPCSVLTGWQSFVWTHVSIVSSWHFAFRRRVVTCCDVSLSKDMSDLPLDIVSEVRGLAGRL